MLTNKNEYVYILFEKGEELTQETQFVYFLRNESVNISI